MFKFTKSKVWFRRVHKQLGLILVFPLALTAVTGIIYQIAHSWFGMEWKDLKWLMALHTGELPVLEKVYAVLNGLGLFVLVVTGLSMLGGLNSRSKKQKELEP